LHLLEKGMDHKLIQLPKFESSPKFFLEHRDLNSLSVVQEK